MSRQTSATYVLRFRDGRSPQELQTMFERHLMSLLETTREGWRLVLRTSCKVNGCPYSLSLRLDDVAPGRRWYTVTVSSDWSQFSPEYDDYFAGSVASWFGYWTRGLEPGEPPDLDAGPSEHYGTVVAKHALFEAELQTVEEVQREVLRRMDDGAQFRTAHKEGGTILKFERGRFVSSTYGETESVQNFKDATTFLPYVRGFFDMDLKRGTYPEAPSEFVAWKLVLRLLDT